MSIGSVNVVRSLQAPAGTGATPQAQGATQSAATSTPVATASAGAAAITEANEVGNAAAIAAPEAMKNGEHQGNRDMVIETQKQRAGYIEGLLKLDIPAEFRKQLEQDLAELKPELERATAIDFLTDAAYATGANAEIIKLLDRATIEVVDDEDLASDAAFNERDGIVYVRKSMIDKLNADIDKLAKEQVLDKFNGKILDAKALRESSEYHGIVVSLALLGAHELGHADQAEHGHTAAGVQQVLPLAEQYQQATDPAQKAAIEQQLVREYVSSFEYETYLAQERFQWEMGAAPKQSGWMTIDNQGNPIDREEAVDRIVAFLAKDGFGGEQVSAITAESADLHGFDLSGTGLGGKFTPGNPLEGKFTPGKFTPGKFTPGKFTPGDDLEGKFTPGKFTPGKFTPGKFTPGSYVEGKFTPGKFTPGKFTPGTELA